VVVNNGQGSLLDACIEATLANGVTTTGATVQIGGNADGTNPDGIASVLGGGGMPPLFRIVTADGGETIYEIACSTVEGTSTIVLSKVEGTFAAPEPLSVGSIIGLIAAVGQAAAGAGGKSAGTAGIRFSATENWTTQANGTAMHIFTQPGGTSLMNAPPVGMFDVAQFNKSGMCGFSVGTNGQDLGQGVVSAGRYLHSYPMPVANLPNPIPALVGCRGFVTDAVSRTYGQKVVGGGAVGVGVTCDGAIWYMS
jgi:hypothetical protein